VKIISTNGHRLPDGFRRIVSETTGKVTFEVVAGVVDHVKIRKQFGEGTYGSEAAALAAGKHWYNDKRGEIRRDRSAVLTVSDHTRLAVLEAERRLEPYGKTLLQAVNTAIEVYKQDVIGESLTFAQAAERFIKHKQMENCRPSYLDDIKDRMQALSQFNGEPLSSITGEALIEFLQDREIGAVTWNNWRRNLRVFFNFCMDPSRNLLRKNPAMAIPEKKVDEEEVEVLSVDQARKLLKLVKDSFARQIPWLALGMFAGLRRNEAQAAQWEDIDWEHNVIKVRSSKVRSVSTRYVELTDAARSFLEGHKQESGPIATGVFARRNDFKEIAALTGIDCSKNLYRHSFGSYHLAQHQNRGKTMDQMGHENLQTFVRWYRRPMPRLVAEAYWNIRPDTLG
jgi:integrase